MPLNPPQDYRKTAFTHRRGVAASRPAAADVLPGTLYFSTDTGITERSTGSAWESYSSLGLTTIDVSTTGTIQNLNVDGIDFVRLTGGTSMTVHSLKNGVGGQEVTFISTAANGFFRHNSSTLGGGTSLQNFIKVTDADTPITDNAGAVTYVYDSVGAQWRMIRHVQGKPIVPTFAAGDFTGNASMTWTVASGDVKQDAYLITGKQVTYWFRYDSTTVGGTVSTQLQRAIPTLLSPLNDVCYNPVVIIDNGGTRTVGAALVANGASIIGFHKIDLSNWTLSTDLTTIQGQLSWFLT